MCLWFFRFCRALKVQNMRSKAFLVFCFGFLGFPTVGIFVGFFYRFLRFPPEFSRFFLTIQAIEALAI